jgi:DNA polymerase-1
MRKAFIPRDADHVLLSADYSQIELRLIAEISGEEAMLDAFQLDSGHPPGHGRPRVRRAAGRSDARPAPRRQNRQFQHHLRRRRHQPEQPARHQTPGSQGTHRQLFRQYRGLKHYMDTTVEFARKHGYVETLLGRRRYLRDIDSRNGMTAAWPNAWPSTRPSRAQPPT